MKKKEETNAEKDTGATELFTVNRKYRKINTACTFFGNEDNQK